MIKCDCPRCDLKRERDAALTRAEDAERELERWRHGVTIEGDFVCPRDLEVVDLHRVIAAYVKHVGEQEGVDFLDHAYEGGTLSPADAERIREIIGTVEK